MKLRKKTPPLCSSFIEMASFHQWLLLLPFTYVYKQSCHLSWRRSITENISPSSRTSSPIKIKHQLFELFDNGYRAITIKAKQVYLVLTSNRQIKFWKNKPFSWTFKNIFFFWSFWDFYTLGHICLKNNFSANLREKFMTTNYGHIISWS